MHNRSLPQVRNASAHQARSLRRNATYPEKLLWNKLRAKRLLGLKFRRQEPIGPYIADFFCHAALIVIEIDGQSHDEKDEQDDERQHYIESQGYQVLRFLNDEILHQTDSVMQTIEAACHNNLATPPPPPPSGEEKDVVPSIVLIGFMGCGKSSVARVLASRLAAEFVDLDDCITARCGMTIAQFFAEHGEAAFRQLETQILREALERSTPAVISTGGGIVTRQENRHLLQHFAAGGGQVIYLEAQPTVLANRIRRQPGLRPLIDGEGVLSLHQTRHRVKELLAERDPLYREVATLIAPSALSSVDETAQQIVEQLCTGDKVAHE